MFAYVLLIFEEALSEQFQYIIGCMEMLCNVSGEKIIVVKSSVFFSRNVDYSDGT